MPADKIHGCDSYPSVPRPKGTEQTQKSLKGNPLKRRVTDYPAAEKSEAQRCRNPVHVFLGRAHNFPHEGGDGARRDASQKIKDGSTNNSTGRENPPFRPVI